MMKWTDESTEKKHRHEIRRETILQAAARCFNRKGYHGTTIEDIAQELRVSKAALYYYVKSKEEVLVSIFGRATPVELDFTQVVKA